MRTGLFYVLEYVEGCQTKIVFDEGYQFGLGLFETIRVENGQPLFLSWHLERLNRSRKEFGISQVVTEAEVMEFLSAEDAWHHALKIMISDKNKLLTLRPNPYTEEQYQKGFRLAMSQVYRNETSPLVRHKTFNYGECILEKRRAKALGVDELIFQNSRGELCEGTTCNLFFVKGDAIYTPPLSCGLLPGILRRFIMEQFPVEEKILYSDDIAQMDECFVTNSLMGVMPVALFGQAAYSQRDTTNRCIERLQAVEG